VPPALEPIGRWPGWSPHPTTASGFRWLRVPRD